MKGAILFSILLLFTTDLDKISKINSLKSEARKAYQQGDYKTAIEKYKYLKDSLGVSEEEVSLNLANAYFQQKDSVNASSLYRSLAQSKNSSIRSVAGQQLGVLANRLGKQEEALDYFKQSLKADPANEDARYNYEMVKKKLEEKKKQQEQQNKDKSQEEKKEDQKKDQQKDNKEQKDKKEQEKKEQQNKEQQNKDQKEQQSKDQKEKEQSEKEKQEKEQKQKEEQEKDEKSKEKKLPPSVSEKLKQMEMSEEKAKMILEAMKNQEVQYLQQNKRKATKPKDRGKPDW